MATLAVLTFAGCAPGQVQMDATAFVNEHVAAATRASAAAKAVEAQVSRLSRPPTGTQLERLARIAAEGRRNVVQVGEWNVAAEGVEEEDLPRAEAEVTEGANDLTDAMSALKVYARALSAAALARYVSELAHGREQWNGGISQLWYLAHRSNPPTV
jgi:hypothetical protein